MGAMAQRVPPMCGVTPGQFAPDDAGRPFVADDVMDDQEEYVCFGRFPDQMYAKQRPFLNQNGSWAEAVA